MQALRKRRERPAPAPGSSIRSGKPVSRLPQILGDIASWSSRSCCWLALATPESVKGLAVALAAPLREAARQAGRA